MEHSKLFKLFICMALTACGSTAASGATTPQPGEVKRTLLQSQDLPDAPGMESRLYLIEFPPSAASKPHTHSTQAVGYVLEGRFESAFGDGPTVVKAAGEAFVDLPGLPHRFRNADSQKPLRFIIAGVFHKGEPLFQVIAP